MRLFFTNEREKCTEGTQVPDGSMLLGSPARVVRALDAESQLLLMHNADHYVGNAARFSAELEEDE